MPGTASDSATHIRPFDPKKDLGAAANLIELCFANTLDESGKRFIRQMRLVAKSRQHQLLSNLSLDLPNIPKSGYVWEQDGEVVANINIVQFFSQSERYYLIANVSVHPDYRHRGIAHALTERTIEHLRKNGAQYVWLQVREDNQTAIDIYQSFGFQEQARRTTWLSKRELPIVQCSNDISIIPTRKSHWLREKEWLNRTYPPELNWYTSLEVIKFQPGIIGALYRLFSGIRIQQLSVMENGRLQGVLIWQPRKGKYDYLWLAVSPTIHETTLAAFLSCFRRQYTNSKNLRFEAPVSMHDGAIRDAGFYPRQTLIWMRADLRDGFSTMKDENNDETNIK